MFSKYVKLISIVSLFILVGCSPVCKNWCVENNVCKEPQVIEVPVPLPCPQPKRIKEPKYPKVEFKSPLTDNAVVGLDESNVRLMLETIIELKGVNKELREALDSYQTSTTK